MRQEDRVLGFGIGKIGNKKPDNTFSLVKIGDGIFRLSEREQFLADYYLKTWKISACVVAYKERFKLEIANSTVKRWLEGRQHVREYLRRKVEQLADANMTKEEYISKVRHLAEGDISVERTTPFFWKLLGEAKGFLKEEDRSGLSNNIQINFVQANGRP